MWSVLKTCSIRDRENASPIKQLMTSSTRHHRLRWPLEFAQQKVMTLLTSSARLIGLDKATAAAVLARAWSLLSGPVTLLMIIHALTPEEQGYIGVFESIVAIRIFVELGLSTVLMQFVAHERGVLNACTISGLEGPKNNQVKVASLLKSAVIWYSVLSILLFFILWLGGSYYFSTNSAAHSNINWQWPILLLSINTAISLIMQPFFGILEGMGKISEFFFVGLISSILMSLSLWGSLAADLNLMAIPISAFAGILPGIVCLIRWRKLFVNLFRTKIPFGEGINWKQDVLPLQIRTAITAILGYFIFNLTMPMIFAMLGSVAAGQFGQTFRLTAMVLGLANAWILTRAALYGRLISLGAKDDLIVIFRRSIIISVVVSVIGCVALAIPLLAANYIHLLTIPEFAGSIEPMLLLIAKIPIRLGSNSVMIALAINTVLCAFVYGMQSFVRAHRKEPFIPNAIIAAITVPLITYLGAHHGGLEWVAWGYFTRTLLIELPLTMWIFNRASSVRLREILYFQSSQAS
jgi:hypothetical protein